VYRDGEDDKPLYTISGNWDSTFTIHDVSKARDIETFDISTAKTTQIITDPLSGQDPWESRLAWRGVRQALESGDMQAAADAKSKLENGQREMRRHDGDGKDWNRLFFVASDIDQVAEKLAKGIGQSFDPIQTVAAWRFRIEAWNEGKIRRPYRGDTRPDNSHGELEVQVRGQADPDNDSRQTKRRVVQVRGDEAGDSGAISSHPRGAPPHDSTLAVSETENEGGGMSMPEKSQVEDFLRDMHSSASRA